MRSVAECIWLLSAMVAIGVQAESAPAAEHVPQPVKVVLETDFTLDVDDVGALATLHALADNGEAEILGISYNEVQRNAAAAIRAVNAWYGRSDIPVGVFAGALDDPDDEHSRYIDPLAKMVPADSGANTEAMSSLALYRQVLGRQPDASVTIISVGFLNNLYELLQHERDLVAAKVGKLVQMGGVRNDGFNFVRHNLAPQTAHVLEHWPGPVVVSQEGGDIETGAELRRTPLDNPIREAYRLWWRGEVKARSSWDQVAVLYGVRGLGALFREVAEGEGRLRNGFTWPMRPGHRTYLRLRESTEQMAEIIEALMTAPPRNSVRNKAQNSKCIEAIAAKPGLA